MTNTIELIKKLKNGETGTATLAVGNAEIKQTKTQKDYLSLTLVDKTGSIQAKMWDWNTSTDEASAGSVWKIKFEYSPFNGSPQLVVRGFEEIPNENVDSGLFIDSLTVEQFKYYHDELKSLVEQISDASLKKFIKEVLKAYPEFFSAPGAKGLHHARLGGLLEHTVHVTKSALHMAMSYKGTPKWDMINTDFLIAGGIIHDIGKIHDYTTENHIIDYDLAITLTGQHGTNPALLMSVWKDCGEPISWEMLLGLMHIQLSHHGMEWALVAPTTFSAWLLHAADISDAKTDAILSHLDGENLVSAEKCWIIKSKAIDETKLV